MARITSMTPVAESGIDSGTAGQIFDQIAQFAGYGFNKSHAAAYAAIAFRTAWLKAHYPEAFFAAAMNLDLDKTDEIAVFAAELRHRRVPLRMPSINDSMEVFTPARMARPHYGHRCAVAYALSAIRGVGRPVAAAIVAERARGAFASLEELRSRMGAAVPKTALQGLAKAGAFDGLGMGRAEALAAVSASTRTANADQFCMFDLLNAAPSIDVPDLGRDTILDNEFDALGHFMSAHPLDTLSAKTGTTPLVFADSVLGAPRPPRQARMAAVVTDTDMRRTKNGDTMAVVSLCDPTGAYEALAFADTWTSIKGTLKKKARVALDVDISLRGEDRRISIANAIPLERVCTAAAGRPAPAAA